MERRAASVKSKTVNSFIHVRRSWELIVRSPTKTPQIHADAIWTWTQGACTLPESNATVLWRSTHTYTGWSLPTQTDFPQSSCHFQLFSLESSTILRTSPSFSRPNRSLSFFSSSLCFTPGSFDHLRRRALCAAVVCVHVCSQPAAPLIISHFRYEESKKKHFYVDSFFEVCLFVTWKEWWCVRIRSMFMQER